MDDGTQIWDLSRHNLQVWGDKGWTKLNHISCHALNGHKLLEISCRGGTVDVTDNHSLVSDRQEVIDASALSVGDKLRMTPFVPVDLTTMSPDLAWLYGFFVADGCVTGGKLRINNQNRDLLNRSKAIFLKHLGIDSYIYSVQGGMYRLSIRKPFNLAVRFKEDCYASDGNKRIPKLILNADYDAKLSFLRGYNAGDGEKTDRVKSEFYRFKTKSPILALGLCFLVSTAC